jgi:hypothetical protein
MNAKDFIQKAWVIEAMLLMVFVACASIWLSADRLAFVQAILPELIRSVLIQGAAAAAGPEIKRFIESRKKPTR